MMSQQHHFQNPQSNPLSLTINIDSLHLKLKHHSLASSKKFDASSKKCDDILECINENKCAISFISHTYVCDIFYIAHLGVRYEIYPAHLPLDLRCQSGIYLINIPQPVQYQLYTLAFPFDLRCESVT